MPPKKRGAAKKESAKRGRPIQDFFKKEEVNEEPEEEVKASPRGGRKGKTKAEEPVAASRSTRSRKPAAKAVEDEDDDFEEQEEKPKAKRARGAKASGANKKGRGGKADQEDSDEDEELKRALEESLKEAEAAAKKPKGRGGKKAAPVQKEVEEEEAEEEAEEKAEEKEKPAAKKGRKTTPAAESNAAAKGKAKQDVAAAPVDDKEDDETFLAKLAGEKVYDPKAASALASQYPNPVGCGSLYARLKSFQKKGSLKKRDVKLQMRSQIQAVASSPDGELMAMTSVDGEVSIIDPSSWETLVTLHDKCDNEINSYYVVEFTPCGTKVLAAGKRMERKVWDIEDDDNMITSCHIKLFDIESGRVVATLTGNEEEVYFLKCIQFKGKNFVMSCSHDGFIRRWHMSEDWSRCMAVAENVLSDSVFSVVNSLAFIPNTGNRYFLAAADDKLIIADMETKGTVKVFSDLEFTCNTTQIELVEPPSDSKLWDYMEKPSQHLFLVSGIEVLADEDEKLSDDLKKRKALLPEDVPLTEERNHISLYRLTTPAVKGQPPMLERLMHYKHDEYIANHLPAKFAHNGQFVIAPSCTGSVFCWNIESRETTQVLRDHQKGMDGAVRSVFLHPTQPVMVTVADDSMGIIYEGV